MNRSGCSAFRLPPSALRLTRNNLNRSNRNAPIEDRLAVTGRRQIFERLYAIQPREEWQPTRRGIIWNLHGARLLDEFAGAPLRGRREATARIAIGLGDDARTARIHQVHEAFEIFAY